MSFEINPRLASVREEVLDAFDPNGGSFRHVIPYGYSNFIDGMAWVGVLCGLSCRAGDTDVSSKCIHYLQTLIDVAKDARNYAPFQVKDEWKSSTAIPGLWYKEKPQESAGPLALRFARNSGAKINIPSYLEKKAESAENLTVFGWVYGFTCKWIPSIRQHMNSIWMAYLSSGKRPPSTMHWMCEDNPLYSYIAKKSCSTSEYPDLHKTSEGVSVVRKKVVPLRLREPDIWVFKDWPYTEYIRSGVVQESAYVPIARLAGDYIQRLTQGGT